MTLAFVGEAPGKEEEALGIPFIGQAGSVFDSILKDAGIARANCFITNTFNERPGTFYARVTGAIKPDTANDLKWAQVPSSEAGGYSPISAGLYLNPDYIRPNLERLTDELRAKSPTVIVAMGNTALWALTGQTKISRYRGTVIWSEQFNCKIVPTYHPAAVMREWKYRPVVLADFIKAKRESEFPEVSLPSFNILIPENDADIRELRAFLLGAQILAVDIETSREQITCIGFAPSKNLAVVIPFWDLRKSSHSYWEHSHEVLAWKLVKDVLESDIPKLGQNFMYDLMYLLRMRIQVRNFCEDTMLMHHALYPELEKSLAFLGSIYTDQPAWKQLRPKGRRTEKKDE